MLLEIPSDIYSANSEILFPPERPVGIISPAKKGVLLYGVNGKLAGQTFWMDKDLMRVSIADGSSVDVKKEGDSVTVYPSPLSGAEKKNETNFFVFGDTKAFQYKLYIKKPGVKDPIEAAVVAKHLCKPTVFCKINEGEENPFRILLILISINLL